MPGIREALSEVDFKSSSIVTSTNSTIATHANLNSLANSSPSKTDSEEQRFAKAEKERDSRRKQTCADQVQQDLMQHYVGIKNGPQLAPGNSIRSGLAWTKEFTSSAANVFLSHFFQEGYREARRRQALPQWQEKLQWILQQALIAENPMYGAWIVDQDIYGRLSSPECAKGRERECRVHGHPDWRVCRYERRSAALERNCNQYL